MKILIVEDDPSTRAALGKLLRRAGAEVVTAENGVDGLRYLLTSRFDVLLTDLHMPGAPVDGFELIEQTHRLPLANRPRRVVAISGEYDRPSLHDALDHVGMVDFFPKPVDLNQLLDTIGGRLN